MQVFLSKNEIKIAKILYLTNFQWLTILFVDL